MRTSTIFQSTIALLFILSLTTTKAQEKNNRMSALNTHQQTLASISALTATGNLPELKSALNKGLDAGLTINEIKESLVQLYAYCGFPRSLNGISTLMTVIEERKDKNIKDPEGKSATPVRIAISTNPESVIYSS
jgi:4-carboxymuconolactone decarboxylase